MLIGMTAIIGVAACDSTTAPDSSLAGQYELTSIDGDTALSKPNPDGFVRDYYGFVILRNDGSYSYAVMTMACRDVFECTPIEVKVFGGTWSGDGSDIDMIEAADGTTRQWHYSDLDLSGQEPKFFNGSKSLVFRKCGEKGTYVCALYPGT
jgi:hypothetical protein